MVWKTIKQKTSEALLSLAMVMLAISCTQLDTKTEKPAPVSTTTSLNNFNNSSTPLSDITITTPTTNPYTANSTSITISGTCTENATVYLSGGKHLNRFCLNQQFSFSVTPSSSGTIDFFIKQTLIDLLKPILSISISIKFILINVNNKKTHFVVKHARFMI
jgi:hypothetical protein